jgi:hypothetical protein
MIGPDLGPGIEQRHQFTGLRIKARDIRSFAAIAGKARQREILGVRPSPMLFRNNVVDFERRKASMLGDAAVFTSLPGSVANELSQVGSNVCLRHSAQPAWSRT